MPGSSQMMESNDCRLDKWLWAARFFKTRSLAKQAIEAGHVRIAGERIKPSRMPKVGELISVTRHDQPIDVTVVALSTQRGSAAVAQTLYEETPESRSRREQAQAERLLSRQDMLGGRRPTKRERRTLDRWRDGS